MASGVRGLFRKMDPTLADDAPKSAQDLLRWHSLNGPGARSLGTVIRRHLPQRSTSLRFLSYNTYLLRLSASLPLGITLEIGKDETAARSTEIGERFSAENYDLACYYEVFQPEEHDRLLAGIGRPVRSLFGGTAASLMMVSAQRPFLRSNQLVYKNRGKTYRISNPVHDFEVSGDSDWYARKGVLMAEVDTGLREAHDPDTPVAIEIFATHLLWGGGMPAFVMTALNALTVGSPIVPVDDRERFDLQMAQIDEFLAFYHDNHNPQNVAILCGDFNIDGTQPQLYQGLTDRLRQVNLADVWGDGRYFAETAAGQTARNDDGEEPFETDFTHVCAPYPGPGGEDYCDENANIKSPSKSVGRFDYIFVERPTTTHRCRVDPSRVRRRKFRRGPHSGAQAYLSDHLGLETTLHISLKR